LLKKAQSGLFQQPARVTHASDPHPRGLSLSLSSCFAAEVDLDRSSIRCAVDDDCPVDARCRADRCVSHDLPERCGDGIIDLDGECDDGNGDPTDACADCRVARCGDGVIRATVGGTPIRDDPSRDCARELLFQFIDGPTAGLDIACSTETAPVTFSGSPDLNELLLGTADAWE